MGNILRKAASFFRVAYEWLRDEFRSFFQGFASDVRDVRNAVSELFCVRARLAKAVKRLIICGVEHLVSMVKKENAYRVKVENLET